MRVTLPHDEKFYKGLPTSRSTAQRGNKTTLVLEKRQMIREQQIELLEYWLNHQRH